MKNTRTNKKKTGKKAVYKEPSIRTRVPTLFGFIKPHEVVTLHYVEPITSGAIVTLTAVTQNYRLNSIFDPNRTGAGHQPFGRDILATIYNRYRVLNVRWKVTFPSNADVLNYAISPYNGSFVPNNNVTDFEIISENPRGSYSMTGYNGCNPAVMTGFVQLADLCGSPRAEYNSDDRFQSVMSTNATEVLDLNIVIYNSQALTQTSNYVVELYMHCDVFDPVIPGIS
jgi:hypothetical protein